MRVILTIFIFLAASLFCTTIQAQIKTANGTSGDTIKKTVSKPGLSEKVKTSKKHDGLFTLYQDTITGSLQLYIKKDQLQKEYIYQSFSLSGPTRFYLHQSMHRSTFIFQIKKTYDKLEFSIVNTRFYYNPESPISKAANVDVSDAVFYSEKFSVEDSSGYLLNVDGLFLSEKLDPVKPQQAPGPGFSLGSLNPSKSKVSNLRSYPNNTDVMVDLAYDNPLPGAPGGKDITDARYVRIKLQHSFLEMPKNDYKPRFDDPRVGYFMSEVDDMTSNTITNYRDVIHRWHLKKKNPDALLSEPEEPITFWIENTTPLEYRAIIKAAGERWNEAFEKAGFKNAVVLKQMPDDADWDPADIRYNVIRWVSSAYPPYGAIGPCFVNPRTGQILGSDITIEWASGGQIPFKDVLEENGVGSDASFVLPNGAFFPERSCNIGTALAQELMAGITLIQTGTESGDPDQIRLAHEQFLYYLVLHEMGHTLGLQHNMKASQMLSPQEVHQKSITQKKGLMGSVMDYPCINIHSDRTKQGDYYTTKPGPYDHWAIEFGYREFHQQNEKEGLSTLLRRSHEPELCFGNDADDMRSPGNGIDPRVMINDMSNDMITYAEDRFRFVNQAMSKLVVKYAKQDRSYMEVRARYNVLHNQRVSMANAVSRYIGGVQVDRSFPGQQPNNKPFRVTPFLYQKKAMAFLSKQVFAPDAFEADKPVLPYLQQQRRGYNFYGAPEDPKHTTTVLSLQVNVLAQLLHPNTLRRINNSSLYGNNYGATEVLNDLVSGIFKADLNSSVNLYRQNLQTEFVKMLIGIKDAKTGYDSPSQSVVFLTLKKIKSMLSSTATPDENTRAHRTTLVFMIDQATNLP